MGTTKRGHLHPHAVPSGQLQRDGMVLGGRPGSYGGHVNHRSREDRKPTGGATTCPDRQPKER